MIDDRGVVCNWKPSEQNYGLRNQKREIWLQAEFYKTPTAIVARSEKFHLEPEMELWKLRKFQNSLEKWEVSW